MNAPNYARPASTADALELLRATPDARLIAGGTDLMVQMRLGHRRPPLVIDTMDLADLQLIESDDESIIGAAATLRAVLGDRTLVRRYPALAEAIRLLGGHQIQAVATIGGNLCNASPAAETSTPLLVYGAAADIDGPDGRRTVPLADFFEGPGRTVLRAGELLVAVRLPRPGEGCRSAYKRLELRRSVDIAIVSTSVCLDVADDRIASARVAIGAVSATARRVPEAEATLVGAMVGDDLPAATHDAIRDAATACRDASRPIDDARASARYRAAMIEVIAERTMSDALAQNAS